MVRTSFLDMEQLFYSHMVQHERHRTWPALLWATDIDSLGTLPSSDALVEIGAHDEPLAIFEFKAYRWSTGLNTAVRALCELARRANVPFWVAVYSPDTWDHILYRVIADGRGNYEVDLENPERLTEREFVAKLFSLRGLSMPEWDPPPITHVPTTVERFDAVLDQIEDESVMPGSSLDTATVIHVRNAVIKELSREY